MMHHLLSLMYHITDITFIYATYSISVFTLYTAYYILHITHKIVRIPDYVLCTLLLNEMKHVYTYACIHTYIHMYIYI